jgi:tRNA modification GTPase
LLQHDRAIVTETPGTTRDVIEDYLNIQGLPIKIMDTAGIRNVEDIAEKEGVKRSLKSMEDADMVLLILDGNKTLHSADKELIEKSKSKNSILVINKIDLPQKIKSELLKRDFYPPLPPLTKGGIKGGAHFFAKIVKVSARKGTGINRLKDKIVEKALQGQTESSPDIVTNIRHVHALEKALISVNSFISEILNKTPPEFLSIELREALDAIGEISGITTPDDILNRIFSNFCIGK